MPDTPKIADYTSFLVAMADAMPTDDPARIEFDLNQDGVKDQIQIRYEKEQYDFSVIFGKKVEVGKQPTFWDPQIARTFFSPERDEYHWIIGKLKPFIPPPETKQFYLKDAVGKVTAQIDWDAVGHVYPELTHILFHPQLRRLLPAFGLLLRSPSFRECLDRAIKQGYSFKIANADGMFMNPESKEVFIPLSTGLAGLALFLFGLPHELAHQDVQQEDKKSVQAFIDSYVMNEVRPDQFAIKVLSEIGLTVDEKWGDVKVLYDAHKRGEKALLAAHKRRIEAGLTYLEEAYLIYTTKNETEYEQQAALLAKPRHELKESMRVWQEYVQEQVNKRTPAEQILDSDRAKQIAAPYPLMVKNFKENRKDWIAIFQLLIDNSEQTHAEFVRSEHQANAKFESLIRQYREGRLEEIRVENAKKLGVEKYY